MLEFSSDSASLDVELPDSRQSNWRPFKSRVHYEIATTRFGMARRIAASQPRLSFELGVDSHQHNTCCLLATAHFCTLLAS